MISHVYKIDILILMLKNAQKIKPTRTIAAQDITIQNWLLVSMVAVLTDDVKIGRRGYSLATT
jgi:hypothetical protein